jgi:hypothetical protein
LEQGPPWVWTNLCAQRFLPAKPVTLNFIPSPDSAALWPKALTQVDPGARVFKANKLTRLFAGLTFEVTCTRQRDLLDQRSIMSIVRFAGPARHAVARQVHRRVRQPSERRAGGNHDLDTATARPAVEGEKPEGAPAPLPGAPCLAQALPETALVQLAQHAQFCGLSSHFQSQCFDWQDDLFLWLALRWRKTFQEEHFRSARLAF